MNSSHSEFENIVNTETWGPYGSPAPAPVKTGLTKRGKVALSVGAVVLAGGGMLTWQHYDAESTANQVKAQELSIQQQQLELKRLKVLSEANEKTAKTQAAQDAVRQKQIDACVTHNKSLVGKQLGATYASVLSDCQAQYASTTGGGSGMQEAASSASSSTSGGISPGALAGIAAGGGLLLAVAATRGRRANAQ